MPIGTAVDELQYILEHQIELHRTLVDVLHQEYEHMANVQTDGLAEASHAKEVLLSEILRREQLRVDAANRVARALSLADDATLTQIAEKLPSPNGEKLRAARTALGLLLDQAKEANSRNMAFAQASLDRIETMKKNALGISNNTNKENYSQSGVCQPITEQGGRLLSTEA